MSATVVDLRTGEIQDLTSSEASALAKHEQVIEQGMATFVKVGESLAAIRDSRLYRSEHATFESYCRERWGMSRQRAHQLVEAAETVTALSTVVDTPIENEAQARALAPVVKDHGAEVAAEVLKHVAEQSTVTAKAIAKAAHELTTDPFTEPAEETFAQNLATVVGPDYATNGHRYGKAVMGLRNAADEITSTGMTAEHLAANAPDFVMSAIPNIRAALNYLDDFLTALESK